MIVNALKTGMLFFVLTGIFLAGGYVLGREQGMFYALIMAGVMNVGAYFFSDRIALASVHAQEVGPEHPLYELVGKLAQRAGLPMPRVYISPESAPNAFATGRGPNHAAVCATAGLLSMLSEEEVAGVMAHELAHVRHRDILLQTLVATLAGAITYIGYMFMFSGRRRDEESNPLLGLLFLILGPIAAGLVQAAISRQREFAADSGGAQIAGDPMYLATALEKIHYGASQIPMNVNPSFNSMFIMEPLNAMETVGNLFATHPPLEARLMNLIGRPSTGVMGGVA